METLAVWCFQIFSISKSVMCDMALLMGSVGLSSGCAVFEFETICLTFMFHNQYLEERWSRQPNKTVDKWCYYPLFLFLPIRRHTIEHWFYNRSVSPRELINLALCCNGWWLIIPSSRRLTLWNSYQLNIMRYLSDCYVWKHSAINRRIHFVCSAGRAI